MYFPTAATFLTALVLSGPVSAQVYMNSLPDQWSPDKTTRNMLVACVREGRKWHGIQHDGTYATYCVGLAAKKLYGRFGALGVKARDPYAPFRRPGTRRANVRFGTDDEQEQLVRWPSELCQCTLTAKRLRARELTPSSYLCRISGLDKYAKTFSCGHVFLR